MVSVQRKHLTRRTGGGSTFLRGEIWAVAVETELDRQRVEEEGGLTSRRSREVEAGWWGSDLCSWCEVKYPVFASNGLVAGESWCFFGNEFAVVWVSFSLVWTGVHLPGKLLHSCSPAPFVIASEADYRNVYSSCTYHLDLCNSRGGSLIPPQLGVSLSVLSSPLITLPCSVPSGICIPSTVFSTGEWMIPECGRVHKISVTVSPTEINEFFFKAWCWWVIGLL